MIARLLRGAACAASLAGLVSAAGCARDTVAQDEGAPAARTEPAATAEAPATAEPAAPAGEPDLSAEPTTPSTPTAAPDRTGPADPGGAGAPSKDTSMTQSSPPAKAGATPEDTYRASLGNPADEVARKKDLDVGAFQFFFLRGRRGPSEFAAVDDKGHVVSRRDLTHLHHLLGARGQDAAGAHRRVVWLHGGIPIDTSGKPPVADGARALVTDPVLDRDPDGTIRLTGWIAQPPNVKHPLRMEVVAPPSGPPRITFTPWTKAGG